MWGKQLGMIGLVISLSAGPLAAQSLGGVKKVIDPDCDVEKAIQGAALENATGINNPCSASETLRDMSGVDDVLPGKKKKKKDGGLRGKVLN